MKKSRTKKILRSCENNIFRKRSPDVGVRVVGLSVGARVVGVDVVGIEVGMGVVGFDVVGFDVGEGVDGFDVGPCVVGLVVGA